MLLIVLITECKETQTSGGVAIVNTIIMMVLEVHHLPQCNGGDGGDGGEQRILKYWNGTTYHLLL